MIYGAVFDLDGTLLDSMQLWDTLASDYILSFKMHPQSDLDEKLKKMTLSEAVRYLKKIYMPDKSESEITNEIRSMLEYKYCHTVKPKCGAAEFLKMLKENGIKMCVATANDVLLAKNTLKALKLNSFFEAVLTCDEIGKPKNEPDIFIEASNILNTNKENTYVFEDSLHAAAAAKKAGLKVIGIFDDSEKNPNEMKKQCDLYFKDFKEASNNFKNNTNFFDISK